MTRSREDDLAAVRKLYCETKMPIGAIAADVRVSSSTVRRWAQKNGWERPDKPTRSAAKTLAKDIDLAEMRGRVGRVMEWLVVQLENRMKTGDRLDAAEMERSVRAISSLTRSIEKLSDVKTGRDRADREAHGGSDSEEAERLRVALAERLLKLRDQHITRGGDEVVRGPERRTGPETTE